MRITLNKLLYDYEKQLQQVTLNNKSKTKKREQVQEEERENQLEWTDSFVCLRAKQ